MTLTESEGTKKWKNLGESKTKMKKRVSFEDQSFARHEKMPAKNIAELNRKKKNKKRKHDNPTKHHANISSESSHLGDSGIKTKYEEKSPKRKYTKTEKKSPKRKHTETEGESSPPKKMKMHDMKFKQRKEVRKQKKNVKFDDVKILKNCWEELRCESCVPEKKKALLNQICNIVKGHIKNFVYAHDTVRVLETVLAEGTEEHRSALFDELKEEIIPLSKSKYGKYFILKMLRYGSKIQKGMIMFAFKGHVTKLMKHSDAAEVVETAFNECANAAQRFQIIQEFYGASFRLFKETDITNLAELLEKKPECKTSIITSMKEELLKLLGKSIVKHSLIHHVLLQFFSNCDPASRSEIIESLREVVPEILHTKDGSRVAMQCVWYGTIKDRKAIVKSMKTYVKKIAMEEHGHMVLLALFDCVDDTSVIEKIIIKELQKDLLEISQNVHGKKVLVYLLSPRDPHFCHPDIINILKAGDNNETSKKDPEKRQSELKLAISTPLTQLIVDQIAELYRQNSFCLFTATILKHTIGDKRPAYESISQLLCEPLTSENKNTHAIENPGSCFMVKQLILNDTKCHRENEDSVTFSEVLVSTVPPGVMKSWFHCNRGAFILVSLIETEIPAVVDKVREELTGCRKHIDKFTFKGAQILVTKLRNFPVNE